MGRSPDGSFHGGLIRIDLGADGLPLNSVTFAAPNVTLSQVISASSFKGTLSADGHSIEGTWAEGKDTSPLTLALATSETTWHHHGPAAIPPMSPTADPSFDVAIIKQARPDENRTLFNLIGRKFTANHCTAVELIKIAYYVRGKQVANGAPWTASDLFDVVAEPDTEGIPSEQRTSRKTGLSSLPGTPPQPHKHQIKRSHEKCYSRVEKAIRRYRKYCLTDPDGRVPVNREHHPRWPYVVHQIYGANYQESITREEPIRRVRYSGQRERRSVVHVLVP